MIGYKLINLGDASNPTDALNKKYVDTCKQYSRWLWTFSVWYVHEQLKNEKCTHPVNDYAAVDKLFYETRYRKMKNDHQLKISNDGRWEVYMPFYRHRIKHRNLGLLDNFFCQFFFYFSLDNVFGPLFGPFFLTTFWFFFWTTFWSFFGTTFWTFFWTIFGRGRPLVLWEGWDAVYQ